MKAGAIIMKDATCPAIYAALQAAEKGIPFMPLRGLDRLRPPGASSGVARHRQSVR